MFGSTWNEFPQGTGEGIILSDCNLLQQALGLYADAVWGCAHWISRLLQRFHRNLQEKYSYCLIEDAAHMDLEARSVMTSSYHQEEILPLWKHQNLRKMQVLGSICKPLQRPHQCPNIITQIHKTENSSAATFLMKEDSTFQSWCKRKSSPRCFFP